MPVAWFCDLGISSGRAPVMERHRRCRSCVSNNLARQNMKRGQLAQTFWMARIAVEGVTSVTPNKLPTSAELRLY